MSLIWPDNLFDYVNKSFAIINERCDISYERVSFAKLKNKIKGKWLWLILFYLVESVWCNYKN